MSRFKTREEFIEELVKFKNINSDGLLFNSFQYIREPKMRSLINLFKILVKDISFGDFKRIILIKKYMTRKSFVNYFERD